MKKRTFFSLCLILLLLTGCGGKQPTETTVPESTEIPETTAPVTTASQETLPLPAQDHIIETPYGKLHFPGDWVPFLHTEVTEDPYTVTFYAVLDGREELQALFALSFGGKAEEAVGAVKTADGYAAVTVHYETFTPDDTWSDREINIVFTMQEALNKVLENLPLESTDVLKTDSEVAQQPENKPAQKPDTETLPPEMLEDMALDTPYMELHYPSEWADYLSIKVNKGNPYSVGYYCSIGSHADQHLFTVYFGGQKGTPLKTIKTESGEQVEIRIDVPELSLNDSWTEEEKTFAFAMQEDLNYLLGKMS